MRIVFGSHDKGGEIQITPHELQGESPTIFQELTPATSNANFVAIQKGIVPSTSRSNIPDNHTRETIDQEAVGVVRGAVTVDEFYNSLP